MRIMITKVISLNFTNCLMYNKRMCFKNIESLQFKKEKKTLNTLRRLQTTEK